ncbi:hypothetical protein AB7V88_11340 [Providencia rettgeri]|uniref:hypothetical protein n=1 Tax=unclassified Providencia TaxID=2633465 RepID=UPI00234A3E13|nr:MULTISPECIES: hypothetical protein [unclassified Providencia]
MDNEHKLTDLTHEQLIELMLQNPSVQEEYERLTPLHRSFYRGLPLALRPLPDWL